MATIAIRNQLNIKFANHFPRSQQNLIDIARGYSANAVRHIQQCFEHSDASIEMSMHEFLASFSRSSGVPWIRANMKSMQNKRISTICKMTRAFCAGCIYLIRRICVCECERVVSLYCGLFLDVRQAIQSFSLKKGHIVWEFYCLDSLLIAKATRVEFAIPSAGLLKCACRSFQCVYFTA